MARGAVVCGAAWPTLGKWLTAEAASTPRARAPAAHSSSRPSGDTCWSGTSGHVSPSQLGTPTHDLQPSDLLGTRSLVPRSHSRGGGAGPGQTPGAQNKVGRKQCVRHLQAD